MNSSFQVATDKVARKLFFRFVCIVSEGVPVPAYAVQYLAVLGRVSYNFIHDLVVSCIYKICVGNVDSFLPLGDCSCSFFCRAIGALSILTVLIILSFSIVTVFGLTVTTANGPDFFGINLCDGLSSFH